MDGGYPDIAPMRKVGEDVGVTKVIGEPGGGMTTKAVVGLAMSELEVIVGIVVVDVMAAPADTTLVWRARQAGSVDQIGPGGSTAPVLARWS